ncbi:TonB-dependent receptor plug domain-containing protein [Maribellus comscasis]|uniref:TonB-dependent receptor plug domain-containing protein n=1 Tax=Maribellus comscasis TaxID=2681766 RepID=A0A6I6JY31_9BACT|nr:TonB-dependent receptor [Maribellus comscasis]QGY46058.1 TonB-dependent receptor plug domain-containing protein [Maribellus comscasis]
MCKNTKNYFLQCVLRLLIVTATGYLIPGTLIANNARSQSLREITVTLDFTNDKLTNIFWEIEEQTSLQFSWPEEIESVKGISITAKAKRLDLVMDELSEKASFSYKQVKTTIAISKNSGQNIKEEKTVQPPGGIKGSVKDAETGEVLVGASIALEGTTAGTITNMSGNFTLSGIPPGTYTIEVSFIGYQKRRFEKVKVTSGEMSLIDVKLSPASEDLDEVKVTGRVNVKTAPIRNTDEFSLLSTIRASDLMVAGISSEQIAKSLDRDASDVVKRAPGVSMQNKFVLIRGMAPRYIKTYINGMQMPSSESFQRAFAFDLIPSGVIDAIEIYRTPAPELPGGFGGGIIKVSTKKSQVARRFQFNISGDYDTETGFTDLYTGSNDASDDWMGMGADDREFIPQLKDLPSYNLYPAERLEQLKTMMPANRLEKSKHNLNRSFGFNYYDSWLIGNVRINNLTSLNYTYKRELNTRYRFYYSNLIDYDHDRIDGGIERLDSISTEKVRLNALQSLHVEINDNHRLGFDFFANRNATDASSIAPRATYGSAAYRLSDSIPKDIQLGFTYKVNDLYSGQFSGSHQLGKHSIDWNYGRSYFKSFVPDQEIFDFQYMDYPSHQGLYQVRFPSTQSGGNSRSSYTIEEKGEHASLNYVFELNTNSTLKAGGAYTDQVRTSSSSDYYWISHLNDGAQPYMHVPSPWLNLDELFGPDLYNTEDEAVKDFVYDATDNNYRYENRIWAGYLGWKQSLFKKKIDIYGGVRYEYEFAQLYDKNGDAVTEERTPMGNEIIVLDLEGPYLNYWLPSLYATWNIAENQRLRAGYGKTLDRAFARERSLDLYVSVEEGKIYTGNKVLRNASLDNADLRWEFYPSESEFLAAGLFYKHIKNPIENFEWESERATYALAVNYKKADLYGAEIEIRKNFGFIPVTWSDRFSLIANISYTYTEIENSFFSKGSLVWTDPKESNRPLTGTTPFLVNANLYYTDPKYKTQLSLNYNYTSQTLLATGDTEFGYLYQDAYDLMDITIIQPMGKNFTLKTGVKNLFKKDITGWRDRDFDGKKRPDVLSNNGQKPVYDIENAMRDNTIRLIYLGISATF